MLKACLCDDPSPPAGAAPIRAKEQTIKPINARSRKPACVVTSMMARADKGWKSRLASLTDQKSFYVTLIHATHVHRKTIKGITIEVPNMVNQKSVFSKLGYQFIFTR
jgi:hypothetical protein